MPDPRRDRARVLLFLGLLHMVCHALLTMLTPLYVAMQRDFGVARIEPVTELVTVVNVVFALATLAAGWLCDRAPGRWVAGVGLALHGLGMVGLGLAPNLAVARLWMVVAGIGAAGYHPVAARQIIGLYPEAVGRAMGLVAIGAAVGFYVGPQYAGWRTELVGWHAPQWLAAAWRQPVLEAGCAAMTLAALYLLLTREPLLDEPCRSESPAAARRNKAYLIGAVGLLGLLLIPRDFAGIGFDALNSLFLQHSRGFGLSVGVVGTLLGAKGLISLVTNPLMAWLSDRGHRLWWWAATLLGSGVFGALVPWLPPTLAKWALVMSGMLFLANFPIFETALVERLPARVRGRAYALILAIVGVFAAYAPKQIGRSVDLLVPGDALVPETTFAPLYLALGLCLVISLVAVPLLNVVEKHGDQLDG